MSNSLDYAMNMLQFQLSKLDVAFVTESYISSYWFTILCMYLAILVISKNKEKNSWNKTNVVNKGQP